MKVLLRKNVYNLGKIGDVVEVKPGYARNCLLPLGLAFQPTEGNLKRVEIEKKAYLEELAKQKAQLQARAAVVNGKEVTITARANEEGLLYGSVGPAQIVAALAEQNVFIEEKNIVMAQAIRKLDKFDLEIRLGDDVTAAISVWVVPSHDSAVAEPETDRDDEDESDE